MELLARCEKCRESVWIKDEGQHITLFECLKCGAGNSERHRPDPEPLPIGRDRARVDVIRIVVDSFARATISLPLKYKTEEWFAWLGHAHESAQQTVNHLFGYVGRKTIMMGRKKDSAAVAPNGRAAVL